MTPIGGTTSSASRGTISTCLFVSTAAGDAIVGAVNAAFERGDLIVDANGLYVQVFEVGGNSVTVSGRVIDGAVRIGTAWIPP